MRMCRLERASGTTAKVVGVSKFFVPRFRPFGGTDCAKEKRLKPVWFRTLVKWRIRDTAGPDAILSA